MTNQISKTDRIAQFFESFLPQHIASLGLGEMDSFTTTFGFVIDDIRNGHWVYRFEHGVLKETKRVDINQDGDESFSYHMDQVAFWEVVGGQDDPRAVFLSGRAEIVGDTEQALKAGMILAQFSQKYPYRMDQSANLADGGS